MMLRSAISLKLVVETCMGGATPVYNLKKTSEEFPYDFPFIEYHLLDPVSENSAICNLFSDRTNFIPPSRNTEQLSKICVK